MKFKRYMLGAMALSGSVLLFQSGQVAAQGQSASASAMLEEVVVTARRREENLQDLPLSIQAITADAMEAQGIYNMQQLTDFVPNVVLTEDQRKNDTRMYIRGIGGGFSNPAQVFGVGMYVDGHYLSGSLGAFMSTLDIERVEILRGPQGTLFGKNTTGGAISIISAKPGPEFDSYVTLRAASYGQQDLRAMINLPITDSFFFRGNFATETSDGHYYNRFLDDSAGGTDQQSLGLAFRWELGDNWTIDGRLASADDRDDNQGGQCRAYPRADMYTKLMNGGTPGNPLPFAGKDLTLGTADDVTYNGPGPFASGSGAWGSRNDDTSLRIANFIDAGTGLAGPGGSDFRVDALYPGANAYFLNSCAQDFATGDVFNSYQDYNTRSYVDNDMVTINALWESDGAIGPFEAASLQIQTGSRYTSYRYQQDRDFGPGIIDHIGNNPNPNSRGIQRNTDEFEIIFSGEIGDRVTLTAGAYYFNDEAQAGSGTCLSQWIAAWDPAGGAVDGTTGLPAGLINGKTDDDVYCTPEGGTLFHRLPDSKGDRRSSTNAGRTTGESTALFGHAVFHLNDAWDLAIGARWMHEERGQAHIEYGIVRGTCSQAYAGPLEMCNPTYLMNRKTMVEDGIHANVSAEFDEVTPLISISRQFAPGDTLDSGMLYATIAQGFLTGAFNDELNPNNPGFTPAQRQNVLDIIPYGPEYLTNYEFGFKGTLLDGRVRVAANIFYMDYTDKQEAINVDNTDGRFGPDPSLEYTQNAADVDIKGIELELRASPWDGGFISLDLGYLESVYASFKVPDLDNLGGPLIDVSNSSIANRTPEWTVTMSVEHAFLLGNGATLTPQIGVYMQPDFEWRSGIDVGGAHHPICHNDGYSKVRGRVSYVPQQGNWQAALFGYNITDERILFKCGPGRSGSYKSFYEAPATWGAEFTMRFGG